MKRLLHSVLLSLVLAGAAQAQPPSPDFGPAIESPAVEGLDGRWEGAIETPEGPLPGVFRITTSGGKTVTLLDSPTQGAISIPGIAKRDGKTITIDVPVVTGSFKGELSADGAGMSGTWSQNGMSFPLSLTRK